MTITRLFSYGYAWQQIKNAPPSLVISMAMQIRRYNAERITQYGRSRATLDATVFCVVFRPTATAMTMASAGPIRRDHTPDGAI